MEQRHRLSPLVRFKLPRLARRQHRNDTVPRVRSEFRERVDAVDDVIPRLRFTLLAGGINVCVRAVDGDDVFRARIAFGGCTGAGGGRVFESGYGGIKVNDG